MNFEQIGKYKIEGIVGRGGMATVYLGEDPTFGRQVAIKVLPEQFVKDEEFQKRFAQEAQVIAALEHAAIVPVYDFGQENEQPYLVMRYMPGGSLAERIRDQNQIKPRDADRILDRLCAALDYAHSQKIIHRDLKPENILFGQGDDVYLSDFGIAKLMEATTNLTGEGAIGTPRYMSPEQAYGKKIDYRTDLYSLGVILYEMLTGRPLFQAETPMGLAMAHIMEEPPNILDIDPNLPARIKRVLDVALAKDPEERFQAGRDLSRAFSEAIRTELEEELSFEDLVVITKPQKPTDDAGTTKIPTTTDGGELEAITTERIGSAGDGSETTKSLPATESLVKKTADGSPTTVSPISDGAGAVTIESRGTEPADAPPKKKGRKLLSLVRRIAAIVVATAVVVGLIIAQLRTGFIGGLPGGPRDLETFQYDTSAIEALEVFISVGATEISIGETDASRDRIEGSNTIEAELQDLNVEYLTNDVAGRLTIQQEVEPIYIIGEDPLAVADIDLPTTKPINLTVVSGLGDISLDLAQLNVRTLDITNDSSAATVSVNAPTQGNTVLSLNSEFGPINFIAPSEPIDLNIQEFVVDAGFGSSDITLPVAGDYTVDVTANIGSTVTLLIPRALEARVLLGASSVQTISESAVNINSARLTDQGDDVWETANYVDSENKAEIVILGAQGTIDIVDVVQAE